MLRYIFTFVFSVTILILVYQKTPIFSVAIDAFSLSLFLNFTLIWGLWLLLSALRFFLLFELRSQCRSNFRTIIAVYFQSFWGMYFLPSSLGMDFIKILMLKTKVQSGLRDLFVTTLIEKISGFMVVLATLIVLSAFVFLAEIQNFDDMSWLAVLTTQHYSFTQLLFVVTAKLALSYFLLVVFLSLIIKRLNIFIDNAYHFAAKLTVLSFGIHTLGMMYYVVIAQSLGFEMSEFFYLLVVPLIFLVSAIPISFGGWGIREGFTIAILAWAPEKFQSAIAGTYGGMSAFLSAVSLVCFIWFFWKSAGIGYDQVLAIMSSVKKEKKND